MAFILFKPFYSFLDLKSVYQILLYKSTYIMSTDLETMKIGYHPTNLGNGF